MLGAERVANRFPVERLNHALIDQKHRAAPGVRFIIASRSLLNSSDCPLFSNNYYLRTLPKRLVNRVDRPQRCGSRLHGGSASTIPNNPQFTKRSKPLFQLTCKKKCPNTMEGNVHFPLPDADLYTCHSTLSHPIFPNPLTSLNLPLPHATLTLHKAVSTDQALILVLLHHLRKFLFKVPSHNTLAYTYPCMREENFDHHYRQSKRQFLV